MINNINSPLSIFKKQLKEMVGGLNQNFYDYCYFLPMYGLGDKITFISAFAHIKKRNIKIAIIAKKDDPLIFIYTSVADLLIYSDEIYNPWLHADNFVDSGRICSMWHLPYFGGILGNHINSIEDKGILDNIKGGHKMAVKFCCNIDITLPLVKPLVLDRFKTTNTDDYIFISPIANSMKSMDPHTIENLATCISSYGLKVIFNLSNNNEVSTLYKNINSFEIFSGDIQGALLVAAKSKLAINMRSGISDLHSAIGLKFVDVYPNKILPFWSLEENFFTSPIAELTENTDLLSNIKSILNTL